jgi:site-specific DNA-methyltransferase (adenine-specific)
MQKIQLYNGDCLEVMDRLIEKGVKVDAIITDPPYGTTACKWDSVIHFEAMWERLNKLIKDNGAIVLFGSEPFSSALRMSNIKNYKYDWVWEKQQGANFANVNYQPFRVSECVSVFGEFATSFNKKKTKNYNPQMSEGTPYLCKSGKQKHDTLNNGSAKDGLHITENKGQRHPRNIIKFNHDKTKHHPTQKPVALMEYLVKTYTNEGEIVLDFTMGSGTTGVACKNLNRKFIGIELDEKYFNIAKERIEKEPIQQEH